MKAPGGAGSRSFRSPRGGATPRWTHRNRRARETALAGGGRRGGPFLPDADGGGDWPASGPRLVPAVERAAPVYQRFSAARGEIAAGDSLTIQHTNGSGTVYYTLDGSDPRLPHFLDPNNGPQGEVAPGASMYTGAITLDGTTTVKARVLNNGGWSALTHAVYSPASVRDSIRITEIMYHPMDAPAGNPDAEFIELQNIGDTAVDLTGVAFTAGVSFTFPSISLAPGAYIVVVLNTAAFESVYGPGINVAGEFGGRLSNGGERIVLEDALGNVIHQFRYRDDWHRVTDGEGHTLTIVDTGLDPITGWSDPSNWRPSSLSGGTPGTGDDGNVPSAD